MAVRGSLALGLALLFLFTLFGFSVPTIHAAEVITDSQLQQIAPLVGCDYSLERVSIGGAILIQCIDPSGANQPQTIRLSEVLAAGRGAGILSENQTNLVSSDNSNAWCSPWDLGCMGIALLKGLGSLLMGLSAGLLGLVGIMFDSFVQWTIIDFRGTLESVGIFDTINKIWAFLRDIGNILIIGIFVFIAIATILNNQNYGARKLIAKVLIVAVLLNFSMFFAKLAIDASNFVSRQIYSAIQVSAAGGAEAGTTEPIGIAESITKSIGISGLFSSGLNNIGNNALGIVTYSLGATAFMMFFAAILAYGAFLIISRAIVMFVLLLTSSVAFAAILIPGDMGEKTWKMWKEGLINATVFAPVMMLGLFVSYIAISKMGSVNNSLGAFLESPAGNADAAAAAASNALSVGQSSVLIFIFAAGLLFVTMKIASNFANKVAGFGFAAAIPGLGLTLGFGGAAKLGRNTIGRGAARYSARQAERAQELTAKGKHVRAGFASALSGLSGGVSKSSFNMLNTGAARSLTGEFKNGPLASTFKNAAKSGKGGFEAEEKARVKAMTERAESRTPSEEQKEAVQQAAFSRATPTQQQAIREGVIKEEAIAQQKTQLEKQQKDETRAKEDEIKRAAALVNRDPGNARAQTVLEGLLSQKRNLEESQRVAQAQIAQEEAYAKTVKQEAEKAANIPKEVHQSDEEIAAGIAYRRGTNLPGRALKSALSKFGVGNEPSPDRDVVAQQVRGSIKKNKKKKQEKERAEAYFGENQGAPNTTQP